MKQYTYSFITLFIALVLVGCGSTPKYNASGAIPKNEPPSKYGNPATYKALGKTYKIKNSSKGYKETGMASWYGKDFRGKRTSSGTSYNMHGYSAAHKTLPIPTYVKVTNLENHKSVIVRVDDRGPFVKGRIIDLSYQAAKDIGMIGKGTAKVRVEALPPYQSLNKSSVAYSDSSTPQTAPIIEDDQGLPEISLTTQSQNNLYKGQYVIQLSAFSVKENANHFASDMNRRYKLNTRIHFDGNLYRVLADSFSSYEAAQSASSELKREGVNNTIYQPIP